MNSELRLYGGRRRALQPGADLSADPFHLFQRGTLCAIWQRLEINGLAQLETEHFELDVRFAKGRKSNATLY